MPTSQVLVTSSLADFTSATLIVPQLGERDPAGVIQELSRLLQQENRIPDLLQFYHAVMNREFLVSTAMDYGMAFPHSRLPGLKQLSFALGRSTEPLAWGAKAVRSVRLVFMMAIPATDSTQYLLLMSGLARMAKEPDLLAKLHAAEDGFQILEVLHLIKLRTSSTQEARRKALTP